MAEEVVVVNRQTVEDPWETEHITRNELFPKEHEFTKVELMSRCPDNYGQDPKKKNILQKGLSFLKSLKHISKELGYLELCLKSPPKQQKRKTVSTGNPSFFTLDGKRGSNIDHVKLTKAVAEKGFLERQKLNTLIEKETKEKENLNLQNFMIYNYGEDLFLVPPVEIAKVPYLRRHGLSEKEIEILMYLFLFQPGMVEELPHIFPYLDKNVWPDVKRHMMDFINHADRKEQKKDFELYLETFVTFTFFTQMQEIEKDYDVFEWFQVQVNTDNENEEKVANDGNDGSNDDDGSNDGTASAVKKARHA